MSNLQFPVWFRQAFLIGTLSTTLGGCAIMADRNEEIVSTANLPANQPKNVVVLFDGTGNSEETRTNLWVLKSAFANGSEPTLVDYLPGVGTAKTPFLGLAFGFTMEEGIHKGYRFISSNAGPHDKILIFGFSRGAHQARALAGLIAYAGLLDTNAMSDRKQLVEANRILEITKKVDDSLMIGKFLKNPETPPLMKQIETDTGNHMRVAKVTFLGLWDTVPGSSFKEFEGCREKIDSSGNQRYKTGSYPLINNIAHAVSIDEKRSKFNPILLCPAMVPALTKTSEVWFAGAHADVGGGYKDGELQVISMAWMADQLSTVGGLRLPVAASGNPLGRAHWSFGDGAASFKSNCEDRIVPEGAQLHPSVLDRKIAGRAPVMVDGQERLEPYPRACDR